MSVLVSTSLLAQVKIACVGNSITEGWNGYPSYVQPLRELLDSNYVVHNFGKSGATVLRAGDVPYWSQPAFSQVLESDANVILIMLGTNDTKPQNWNLHNREFKLDYAELIDTLYSTNQIALIYPVIPPPVCKDNYGIRDSMLQSQIPILKEIADEKGLALIDIRTPLRSVCDSFKDGIHPTQPAADSIAAVIYRHLVQLQPESKVK